MRLPRSALSFSFSLLLTACSGGGSGGPPGAAAPDQDLSGTWLIQSEVLEADAPCPGLGIEVAAADVTFLAAADDETDIYSVSLPGIDRRPLSGQPSSVVLVSLGSQPPLAMLLGIYYLPAQDVTVELTVRLDPEQFLAASVTSDHFVVLLDFDVYEGDAMVIVDDADGETWAVADDAVAVCRGRVRTVGELR